MSPGVTGPLSGLKERLGVSLAAAAMLNDDAAHPRAPGHWATGTSVDLINLGPGAGDDLTNLALEPRPFNRLSVKM